jgi:carboxyl-terminal processing protease
LTPERGRSPFLSGLLAGTCGGLVVAALLLTLFSDAFDDDETGVEQARAVIEANYFRPVDSEILERASIKGMVDELRRRYDDRFSHYFAPDQLDELEAATSGRFSGVGMTVSDAKRGLRVASVIPETPAERAGIRRGDLILEADGRSLRGVPVDVAAARIKGPPGTEVTLRLVPAGERQAREVTLERASVRVPAVDGELRRTAGTRVAYVRLATFSQGAHGDLRAELERLYREGATGLLLDLRGNGGGLLNEAVLASSLFVEDGLIVSTDSRAGGERDLEAVGEAFDERPTVVLINRDTASAAEILTAALADYDLATVVGTRTFGKGSFQEIIRLPAGGALDITVGEYLTSEGQSLADEGIEPDVRARDDPDTRRDEALRRGLRVLGALLREGP